MSKKSITVVGAGITGLWQALTLARAGHLVRLMDSTQTPWLSNSSALAGAMLAPDCEAEAAEPIVRTLGHAALPLWRETLPGMMLQGSLVLASARDQGEFNRFARQTEGHDRLDAAGLSAMEPDLEGRFASALYFPKEAHMTPRTAMQQLLQLIRDAGAEVNFGVSGRAATHPGQTVEQGKSGKGSDGDNTDDASNGRRRARGFDAGDDIIIDCRGLAARDDLPPHAPKLRGVRGERLIVRSRDVFFNRPLRLLHPRHPLYVVPWPDDCSPDATTRSQNGPTGAFAVSGSAGKNNLEHDERDSRCYMIGATVIESDDEGPMTIRSSLELLGMAYALHPGLGEAEILDMSAGLRPAFPDNVPKIIVDGDRIFVNGMYRHGFLTAPILAQMVADYIEHGTTREDLFVLGD